MATSGAAGVLHGLQPLPSHEAVAAHFDLDWALDDALITQTTGDTQNSGYGGAAVQLPPAPVAVAEERLSDAVLGVLTAAALGDLKKGLLLPRAYPVKDMSAAQCAELITASRSKVKEDGQYCRFSEQKHFSGSHAESFTKFGAPSPPKVKDVWQCATGPQHAGRAPLQRALWLVNAAAAGPPRWVWVFEAYPCCQSCTKGKAKSEVSQHPSAGTGGELTDLDACVAPPSKRQKPEDANAADHANGGATPMDSDDARHAAGAPRSAVYIRNAMDSLTGADSARCAELFTRMAARLRPVSGSDAALKKKRKNLLVKLKRGAGSIAGDRYELWLTVNEDCTEVFGSGQDANDASRKQEKAAQEVVDDFFIDGDRALLCTVLRAARTSHRAALQRTSKGGEQTWGVMALIITAGDVEVDGMEPVDGMSRKQALHVDVDDGHSISLTSMLPGHKATQFVVPGPRATLQAALLQLGIPEENMSEAHSWLAVPALSHYRGMLPGALPMLQRREPLIVSDPDFIADFGHQTVMENLVVHRGLDSIAGEPRIILFLTSTDTGAHTHSGYDKAAQYIRYQFPLALWRLEDALYWLYKDRVDMPAPGNTFGWGDLSDWLNDFVKKAAAADDKAGRTVAQRRAHEPDATWIAGKAKDLAPVYLQYLTGTVGVEGAISPGDVDSLRHKKQLPPTWAKYYFQ